MDKYISNSDPTKETDFDHNSITLYNDTQLFEERAASIEGCITFNDFKSIA